MAAIARPAAEPAQRVLVTGATSVIGDYLLPLLRERGLEVLATSRAPRPAGARPAAGLTWHALDLTDACPALDALGARPIAYACHLAPLWLLPALLPPLARHGVRRLIAFGSTSRFTKEHARDPGERALARRLAEAEAAVASRGTELGLAWTLFRPTLVYGAGRDRSVSAIARFALRWGFFPIAGQGRGRRQPVHAQDLAAACLAALDNPATHGRAYDLVGGSTLTYRELVEAVFAGLGRRPRVLVLPLPVLQGVLWLARRLPGLATLPAGAAERMDSDLCFDSAAAVRDFGYRARPFAFERPGG